MMNIIFYLQKKLMLLVLFCLMAAQGFSATYYVSVKGSDTGNGSASIPFQTIGKAASVAVAGDVILVAGGTYVEENITPAQSGTENAYIVFKPQAGTGDVILKHPGTSADATNPIFNLSAKNYIWIEGFLFKDYSFGDASVSISSAEGNVVINNRFENLGHEEVSGWAGNSVVWIYKSAKCVVVNNYFDNIFGDGVSLNGQDAKYNLVSNNTFLNFKGKLRSWGGSYKYSRAIDVQDMSVGNNVIAFNYAKDVVHHVWLDRDGSANVILRNFGHTGSGTVFNESRCANNIVQENISVNMKVGFMSAYYETTGWTIDPRYVNNVAYANETGFKIHKSKRDEFRNNIACNNTEYNLYFSAEALSNAPHIFRNNLWYTDNKTNSINFKGNAVSVSTFRSEMDETGGLSENPLFVSTISGSEDFTLQATSPAKSAADNGLDLGAFAVYPKSAFGWNSAYQVNDVSDVLVAFNDALVSGERNAQVQLTVKLNKASTEEVSVEILPVAGDALATQDFSLSSTTVTFQAGETSKTVTIDLVGEGDFDELVAFSLTNPTNAKVGARNIQVMKINKTQKLTAFAGENQFVRDNDSDGSADVTLDGTGSQSPNGQITSYVWKENGVEIATGATPTVSLSVGTHEITLMVRDNADNTATDQVIVTVAEDAGIWLEAECATVGSLWDIETDETASNGEFITIQDGNNSTDGVPNATGLATFTFNVEQSGTYTLYARVICPSANDDSFWLSMDGGEYASWNGIASSSGWVWAKSSNTFELSQGSHTFKIGYREDGAKLDKLWFTNIEADLDDIGGEATNCGASQITSLDEIADRQVKVYSNPACSELQISLPDFLSYVCIYNTSGQKIFSKNSQTDQMTIEMQGFQPGVYIVRILNKNGIVVKKVVRK